MLMTSQARKGKGVIIMNDDNEKKVPLGQYTGAIIGGVIALILCFTRVYRLLLYIVIICLTK